MIVLPFDVSLHIASFISHETLRNMYGFNRAFFELAMNERYKAIQLTETTDDPGEMYRQLMGLQNAGNRSRVRKLTLHQGVIFRFHPKNSKTEHRKSKFIHDLYQTFIDVLKHRAERGSRTEAEHSFRDVVAKDFIPLITTALSRLINVEEYFLQWQEGPHRVYTMGTVILPRRANIALPCITPLLTTGGFGAKLRKLQLSIPPQRIRHLIPDPAGVSFPKLEELCLQILSPRTDLITQRETRPILRHIVAFLNAVRLTLRSLAIYQWRLIVLDMDPFFDSLEMFPQLNSLTLNINFAQRDRSIPMLPGLRQFLESQRPTLEYLRITPDQNLGFLANGSLAFREMLSEIILQPNCAPLKSLEASLFLLCFNEPAMKAKLVQNLTALSVTNYRFRCIGLESWVPHHLLQHDCVGLTFLRISVKEFPPSFIRFLVTNLPKLKTLCVSISSVWRSAPAVVLNEIDITKSFCEDLQMELSSWDTARNVVQNWQLSTVFIAHPPQRGQDQPQFPDYEEIFRVCIPSVKKVTQFKYASRNGYYGTRIIEHRCEAGDEEFYSA